MSKIHLNPTRPIGPTRAVRHAKTNVGEAATNRRRERRGATVPAVHAASQTGRRPLRRPWETSTLGAVIALWLVMMVSGTAHATLIAADTVERMAQSADDIVLGRVVAVETFIDQDRVATRVQIEPTHRYKSASLDVVEVVSAGGQFGEFATAVAGADYYREGAVVLVFLERREDGAYRSSSMAYSQFYLNYLTLPPDDDGSPESDAPPILTRWTGRIEDPTQGWYAQRTLGGASLAMDRLEGASPDAQEEAIRMVFEFADLDARIRRALNAPR